MSRRLFIGLCFLLFSGASMAIEEPTYRVIETTEPFELRVYDPKIIAEVEVAGTLKQASNAGFKLIADYIFGNNTSQTGSNERISMTAPVTMSSEQSTDQSEKIKMTAPVSVSRSGLKWKMHFVMPSKYTLATLPKPNNSAVTIRQVDGAKYAVNRFSGLAGKSKVEQKTTDLRKWLNTKNIKPIGKAELARYNPPWTLPFMRRNEVMIKY